MRENMTIQNLYDLRNTMARPLLENLTYPWEALPLIGAFIVELGKTLSPDDYELRGENIWVAKSAKLYPNIYIAGPAIIGPNTEVRPGAFIRGNALIGAGMTTFRTTGENETETPAEEAAEAPKKKAAPRKTTAPAATQRAPKAESRSKAPAARSTTARKAQ